MTCHPTASPSRSDLRLNLTYSALIGAAPAVFTLAQLTWTILPSGATGDRPVPAKLFVHLDNGETHEATPEDLAEFGLAAPTKVANQVRSFIVAALDNRAAAVTMKDYELTPIISLIDLAAYISEHFGTPSHPELAAAILKVEDDLARARGVVDTRPSF